MDENVRIVGTGKHCVGRKQSKTENTVAVIYSIVMIFLFIAVIVSFIGINRSNHLKQEAVEAYKAELVAKQEEESIIKFEELRSQAMEKKTEIEMLSKLFEGVRKFNYSKRDLMTLAWCVFNRVDNPLYPSTIDNVIHQNGQWIAYSDDNAIVNDYYRIAEAALTKYYSGDLRPCSTKYLWAICDRDGIYLVDSVEPGVRAHMW